jgi:hypothetical protein
LGGTPAAACRLGPARASCTNKPNPRKSFKSEVSSVKREKPTAASSSLPTSNFTLQPFGGTPAARCTNKPNWPRRVPERARVAGAGDGEMRETNPICRRGQLCQTNPISPVPGRRGQPIAPNKPNLAGHPPRPAALGLRGPVVQTNPIPPGHDGARRTNKPNSPAPDGQAKSWLEPILPNKANCPKRGTEAVSRDRAEAMDVESTTVCQPHPPPA